MNDLMTRKANSLTQFGVFAILAATALGCGAEKSENPLSPTVAGPIAGVSIDSPVPVSPTNRSEVVNTDPLRLVFNNASSNGVRPLWYVVELGSDTNFSTKLYANAKVVAGEGGRTRSRGGKMADERTSMACEGRGGANESTFSHARSSTSSGRYSTGADAQDGGGEPTSNNTRRHGATVGSRGGRHRRLSIVGRATRPSDRCRDSSPSGVAATRRRSRRRAPVNAQCSGGSCTTASSQTFLEPELQKPARRRWWRRWWGGVVVQCLPSRGEARGVRILPPVSCCPCRTCSMSSMDLRSSILTSSPDRVRTPAATGRSSMPSSTISARQMTRGGGITANEETVEILRRT